MLDTDVSESLSNCVDQALQKDRAQRYPTAAAMAPVRSGLQQAKQQPSENTPNGIAETHHVGTEMLQVNCRAGRANCDESARFVPEPLDGSASVSHLPSSHSHASAM